MSEDWSKLRDVDPLADGRALIEFAIPLAEFGRLTAALASREGHAVGSVGFSRESGVAVAEVKVEAPLELRCQRCFGAIKWPVSACGRVALVGEGEDADRAPPELETILAPDHRISLRDLVEEELLLALPLAALHPESQCATAAAGAEPAEERQRPFAQLGELLKR